MAKKAVAKFSASRQQANFVKCIHGQIWAYRSIRSEELLPTDQAKDFWKIKVVE